ncbi:MAG: hypothetical protein VZQ83_05325 [Eubacterium sp.]|nr:hypothetical protein [Eubacterium sp.]
MKTSEIIVKSDGTGMEEALAEAEKIALSASLDSKQKLRFRLLTEELFGMISTVTGDNEAVYWVENKDKSFDIHLKTDVELTLQMKDKLVSLSSSGKNTAARGFMGKIRDMIGSALLPRDDGPSPLTMGLMSMGSPSGYQVTGDVYEWSMMRYRAEVENKSGEDADAADAMDELERSIVANIADEVSVRIVSNDVEIIISKAF